ncbi:DUF2239 family protein [Maritimibacter fusiformis]|uniref:DUF2239 family protein n=1 Tax=Maritimibacter fusiformis TaxID=2603819 RepID=A0A5D0RKI3_9RHOB|nr:DUF2239 family protein [Maritimibacter fusiformis]TYB81426.1 DUF2239 family protein [Maritimibacter fusiformis]
MTTDRFTAFQGSKRIAQGSREALARELSPLGPHPEGLLVFSDDSGSQTDLDLTGTAPAPRGRPRLGVKAREVTLLPRHWDWLARQRGGASPALRRLVEEAMRADRDGPTPDAAYRFLSAIAGDLPGFEAAIRALYAGDADGFAAAMDGWPGDIRDHALTLAGYPAPYPANT